MSIIPEILLQRVVVNGFKRLKTDSRLIDNLFINAGQREVKGIRDLILYKNIDFSVNYPTNEEIRVPALILQLTRENESEAFVGDMLGGNDLYDYPDQEINIDTIGGHGASTSGMGNLPRKIAGAMAVTTASATSLSFNSAVYGDDIVDAYKRFRFDFLDLYITGGTGAGQVRMITQIDPRAGSLMIDTPFDTIPDSTTVFDIRERSNPLAADGDPHRLYAGDSQHYYKLGTNYEAVYKLTIVGSTQYEVLYLYAILKALFTSQRVYLERQGLQNLALSGSELSPRGDYGPEAAVYQRTLDITFKYTFGFVEEPEVFKGIDLCVTPVDYDGYGETVSVRVEL